MGDALTIRRYRATDHAAVWALHHVAERADAPDRIPPVVADDPAYGDVHRIEDTDLRQGGELLVGVLDDQLVAISGIERVDPERAYVKRGRVHHAHHGRRFGRALMRALEKRARVELSRAGTDTSVDRSAARQLYLSCGFHDVGRAIFGGQWECVLFKKEIAHGPSQQP